jgi:hypothetical protein
VYDYQYFDEYAQTIEMNGALGMAKAWVLDLMAALTKYPLWRVLLPIPEGSMYIFADRVILGKGPTFDGCQNFDDAVKRAVAALSLNSLILACRDDVDLERLSRFPGIGERRMRLGSLRGVTDAGLRFLGQMSGIQSLSLIASEVTDRGLASLPPLKHLTDLSLPEQTSDEGLRSLPELPALRELSLWARTPSHSKVTDNGLRYLTKFPELEELRLDGTAVSGPGLAYLQASPKLKTLRLIACPIDDSGLSYVVRLTTIEKLDLDRTQISDKGLVHLQALHPLKKLSLQATRITDAGLLHLAKLRNLQELTLFDTAVTDRGKQCVNAAIPDCNIIQ